jgi:ribose transport system permease protein
MKASRQTLLPLVLAYAPTLLLYLVVVATFAALAPKFFTLQNSLNVLVQSSAVAVAAVGMTFVLLTAGIDLSVGSVMFLCGTIAGSLVVRAGWPGTLWVAAVLPVMLLTAVLVVAQLVLWQTPFGRQVYAVGNDPTVARKAGVHVERILLRVYVVSGACAAAGGMITLAQLAAVSPNLGQGRELDVITAAVLGGTSLFGGRGSAIGSVFGAVLVETVRNGLSLIDADPYVYPVITGAIIFLAVLLDSTRQAWLARLRRRKIRTATTCGGAPSART